MRRFVVKIVFTWVASRANMLYLAVHTHNRAAAADCMSTTCSSYCRVAEVLDRLCLSDNRGGIKRRDTESRKQPAEIPVVVKIPGFCCSAGIPPLLGSPLGCFRISLYRRFFPPRLSDEHSTHGNAVLTIERAQAQARAGGAGDLLLGGGWRQGCEPQNS